MTRMFLAAGVAALAIAVPATAGPGGGHGDKNQVAAERPHGGGGGGGGQRAAAVERRGGGGGGGFAAPRVERQQRVAIERPQVQARMAERQQMREQVQARVAERQQMRQQAQARVAERQQAQARVAERQQAQAQARQQAQARVAERQQLRANRQQAQTRVAERQQAQANRTVQAQNLRAQRQQQAQAQMAQRQQLRAQRQQQAQTRMAQEQQLSAQRQQQAQTQMAQRQQLRTQAQQQAQAQMAQRQQLRLEAQQQAQAQMAQRQQLQANGAMLNNNLNARLVANTGIATRPVITAQNVALLRTARVDEINNRFQTRIIAPAVATSLIGVPVNTAPTIIGTQLVPLPQQISYLYPATPQYYYDYAPGYVYQVDRSTNLIAALIPLLAGGFMPGTYLPQPYMSSYVPSYYGLDSFYPATYDYGYGYGDVCNRYADGVIYQVDCVTGMVEDVVPIYAGGYGVGQMLPSAYSYYNVPMQYRSMYYPTADYSYWYAPGAIYQYDPRTSLITSVAALMSPGLTIGQPLPAGYDVYNVPYAYRATYYDTPTAWYRYNNGYIYQIDPATQLVTAIVASLLT